MDDFSIASVWEPFSILNELKMVLKLKQLKNLPSKKKTFWRFNFLQFVASFYILIAQINVYETMPALGHALAAVTHSILVNLFGPDVKGGWYSHFLNSLENIQQTEYHV